MEPAGLRARGECPKEEVKGHVDDLELEVERKRALKCNGVASGVNHDAGER
jgi:hypothetical protein